MTWMDQRADGRTRRVYWSVANGIAFQQDAPAADVPTGSQDHPQIAMDERGEAYLVWKDSRGGIYGTSTALRGRNLRLSVGDGAFPSIAIGREGTIAVMYESGSEVRFAAFPPPEPSSRRPGRK